MSTTLAIISIIVGGLTILAAIWKAASDYTTVKAMKETINMLPTKEDLIKMERDLREFLNSEFVSWKDYDRLERLHKRGKGED